MKKCDKCGHPIKDESKKWPKEGDVLQHKKVLLKRPLKVIAIRESSSRICMILCHNDIADNHFSVDACHKSYFWGKYEYYKEETK
jgi:hypothetical protein